MDKTAWGLAAALGAAAAVSPAAANAPATDRILNPASVADLLEPVPDPVATLNALPERQLEAVEAGEGDFVAQYHHHHHHHHGFIFPHYHHQHYHHHHHHHYYHHHHTVILPGY